MKQKIINELKKYQISFLSSIFFGLISYMYMFTNKFPNGDDVRFLFYKGGSVSHGRWGLELVSIILPDVSMPWLWGIISIFILSFSAYLIIKIYCIENKYFQIFLSAIIMTFPSNICIFTYMFTSTGYMIAALFSILSVYFIYKRKNKINYCFAVICSVLQLSIYQPYITTTSSLLVIILILDLINDCDIKEVFIKGVRFFIFLMSSLAMYFIITKLIFLISNTGFGDYASESISCNSSVLKSILIMIKHFVYSIVMISGLSPTPLARFCHIFIIMLCVIATSFIVKERKISLIKVACIILLSFILIISIEALRFIYGGFQIMMFFGFISFYILIASISASTEKKYFEKITAIILALISISNVYTANKTYTIMGLEYENSYAYFSALTTQIQMTPGYREDTKVYIIGQSNMEITSSKNMPPLYRFCSGDMIHMPTKKHFIKNYINSNMKIASNSETKKFLNRNNIDSMPVYPNYGSIRMIDNSIVVKLGTGNEIDD